MLGSIWVVNVRDSKASGGLYIGRANSSYGLGGSVLANDRRQANESREQHIARYRVWLWAEYNKNGSVYFELHRIANLVENGHDVDLMCWCAPKACHGDIVKSCVQWILKQYRANEIERLNKIAIGDTNHLKPNLRHSFDQFIDVVYRK